jgi:N-acyl-D-aspartate/D-glutamate deacylase
MARIVFGVFLLATLAATPIAQQFNYDVIIRGGRIVDGTGNPWFHGDVAIDDGRIVRVGRLGNVAATRVIDASSHVVAPGFIDLHTHSDMPLLADGTAQSKVRQGITVEVLAEGSSVAPRDGLPVDEDGPVKQDWTTFTGYFERVENGS